MEQLRAFRTTFLLFGLAAACAATAGYINDKTVVALVLTVITAGAIAAYAVLR